MSEHAFPEPPAPPEDEEEVVLLELLDRVLDKGVVLSGDITLSVADVDLVYVGLRVLLSSVETAQKKQHPAEPTATGAAAFDRADHSS